MNIASVLFAWALATLLGALFHLWRGGSFWKLFFYLGLSWVGFVLGHFLGKVLDLHFIPLGSLNLGAGVLGSLLLLFLGHWLSKVEGRKNE